MSSKIAGEFEIQVGDHVVLQGLKAAHLNGRKGKVTNVPGNFDGPTLTCVVLLDLVKDPETGQPKNERLMVKMENLAIDQTVVSRKETHLSTCLNCNKTDDQKVFMVCSKCRVSQYCSKECQVAHWRSGHKSECESVRASWKKPELLSDDPLERCSQEESFATKLMDRGKYSKAETHFRTAIEALKPLGERGILYSSLGVALAFQNKFDEAKTAYEKATSLLPMDKCNFGTSNHELSVVYGNFGALLGKTGDYEGGIQKYEKAIQLDPSYGYHNRGLATCCEALGRFREAAEAWEKFVTLCPGSEYLGMAYGYCAQNIHRDLLGKQDTYSTAERKQQEAKMKEMMNKAFEIDPNLPFFGVVN